MPTVGTSTDPLPPVVFPDVPAPRRLSLASQTGASDSSGPPAQPRRRRSRRYDGPPTFHLNIGRVEVPRSLPPTRSTGTQTDESAIAQQAEEDKKPHRKAYLWLRKWVWPVLRAVITVLEWILSHIGFGFRLN